MQIKTYKGGYDRNYFYLIKSEQEVAVIDCFDTKVVLNFLKQNEATLKYIISTHSHFDHIEANQELKTKTKAQIVMYQINKADIEADEGSELMLGKETLKFLYTPGHTADSICVLIKNNLFTGDTLFVGHIGGHFYKDSPITQPETLKRLMTLPNETIIYPGHDYGKTPTSTIQKEKETNPYLFALQT